MKQAKYNIGLVSVSFRKNTPQEILEAMKGAELSYIEWGSDVHAPCNDTARLYEIAEMQRAYGVSCSSYGTYFRLGVTPIDELKQYIDAAKILGTDILRLWCGERSGDKYSTQEKQALFADCKEAARIASENGVMLCMECHKNSFTQRLEDTLALMDEVSSSHFRMYWQPFQWQTESENLEYAQGVAKLTHHIHVFQWKGEERYSLLDGIDEWQRYLSKFSTPRTLLLEFMPDDSINSLLTEASALRTIIGE